jgi:hypothetical protein
MVPGLPAQRSARGEAVQTRTRRLALLPRVLRLTSRSPHYQLWTLKLNTTISEHLRVPNQLLV